MRTLAFMRLSTSASQTSTLPAGSMGLSKGTCNTQGRGSVKLQDIVLCADTPASEQQQPRPEQRLAFSFSAEFMAVMVVSGSKSRLATASKHFFRCGCTAHGFLVWLSICSSSSLDRKKNLQQSKHVFSGVAASQGVA